jgi:flagellar hook-length control protein FliK
LDFGLNLNNQILPDMGKPMDIGLPADQGESNEGLKEDLFQNLLQEKMQPTKVDLKPDDKDLESPIEFARVLPEMPVTFPVAKEDVAPMQQFLTKIDKEAGVKPEVWAEAMLKLNPEEQLKTPADTAKAVVANLEITGDQKQVVIKAYDQLLNRLQENDNIKLASDAEELSQDALIALAPMMAAAAVVKETTVAPAEAPKALNIDKPVKVNAEKVAEKTDKKVLMPVTEKPVTIEKAETGFEVDLPKMTEQPKVKVNVEELKAKLEAMPVAPKAQPAVETAKVTVEKPVEMAQMVQAAPAQVQEVVTQETAAPKFLVDEKKFDEAEALSSNFSDEVKQPVVQNYKKLELGDMKADTKSQSHGRKTEVATRGKEDTIEVPKFFVDNSSAAPSRDLPLRSEGIGAMGAGAAALPREDVNTQELIRNAQVMIRNGGGEVKIKLNPMNLGEVTMKMSVDGDKVQLALDTTTHEAKKLIEGSINELRTTLSANKLSLENVKVDVSTKSNNQFGNHRNDSDNAGREQARQFLNNFREDNRSRRSDISYETSNRPAPRAAAPLAATRAPYARSASASGRLNLVA